MNKELWNLILGFDLDRQLSEYGFSTRLAHENQWPERFTRQAILEYKKFMYLAATSDEMVSPSEIVDIVWHQHLLFTSSYAAFCHLLGKTIYHIPSTHDSTDEKQFKAARKFTKERYELHFGRQPEAFWKFGNLQDALELKHSKVKAPTLITISVLAFACLLKPTISLMYGTYVEMDSTFFLEGFVLLCGSVFLLLELFNRKVVRNALNYLVDEDHFLFNLTPEELIYMKSSDVEHIIHATVSRLTREEKIDILPNRKLKITFDFQCNDPREYAVKDYIGDHEVDYHRMLVNLKKKPVFKNSELFTQNIKQYFVQTTLFVRIFITNLIAWMVPLLIGFSRLATGLVRGKPILFLLLLLSLLVFVIIYKVTQSINLLTKIAIPKFYQKDIGKLPFPERRTEWNFFLNGKVALYAPLHTVIEHAHFEKGGFIAWIKSWQIDTSGGSGCGSGGSCGSSCGGGCGGGCGGCGS